MGDLFAGTSFGIGENRISIDEDGKVTGSAEFDVRGVESKHTLSFDPKTGEVSTKSNVSADKGLLNGSLEAGITAGPNKTSGNVELTIGYGLDKKIDVRGMKGTTLGVKVGPQVSVDVKVEKLPGKYPVVTQTTKLTVSLEAAVQTKAGMPMSETGRPTGPIPEASQKTKLGGTIDIVSRTVNWDPNTGEVTVTYDVLGSYPPDVQNARYREIEKEYGVPTGTLGYVDEDGNRHSYWDLPSENPGPRGMGTHPNDPRGGFQEKGQIGDRTSSGPVQPGKTGPQYGSDTRNGGTGYVGDHPGPGANSSTVSKGNSSVSKPGGGGADSGQAANGKSKDNDPGKTGPQPILLDLDGDGIELTDLSRSSMLVDSAGDGLQHRTAWAGAGDGVLFIDADGNGVLSNSHEYVFTEWAGGAADDLDALRKVFDSNGDGKLTSADARWGEFRVLVSQADGSKVTRTLAELGITEINLTADATKLVSADGSAITGQAKFKINVVDITTATVYQFRPNFGNRPFIQGKISQESKLFGCFCIPTMAFC